MTSYSNPRRDATIEGWPLGGSRRGPAHFHVESDPRKGERVTRTTTGKPKFTTYATQARIVDGDDGRTYIARLTVYGHISIMQGDMQFQHEVVFERDPRYAPHCAPCSRCELAHTQDGPRHGRVWGLHPQRRRLS